MTAAIAPLKRASYPAYTHINSWWGSAPAHLAPTRLAWVCQINPSKKEVARLVDDTPVSFLPMKSIGEDGALSLDENMPLGQVREGFTYFRDGDVLVAKITPCFENGKGALCKNLRSGFGFGTTELHVLRAGPRLLPRYLFYLTRTDAFRAVGAAMMQGAAGQQRVPEEFIRNLMIGCPPLPEQQAVAAFLDRETARIDALVAKKERLIALLEEKRAAMISQAVTRGLDSTVPLKHSGVPWLGQVPAHWQVRRLKLVARVHSGIAKGRKAIAPETIEVPYLRVANVQDGYLDLSEITTITVTPEELHNYSLKPGDVLMNEGGDFDKLGRGSVWHGEIEPCLHQNHVFAVRPTVQVEAEWLAVSTLTQYAKHFFILNSKQSTNLASISSTNLKELPVVLPPSGERAAILAHIAKQTVRIDALMAKVRTHIDRLREYRTALISAAVTGQIDVREAAG